MRQIQGMGSEKPPHRAGVVARAGIEPATFHFSGERCYQLSYLAIWPGVSADLATPTGLEPATSAVTGRRANQLRYGANFLTCWPCQPGNYSVPSSQKGNRAKRLVVTGLRTLPRECAPASPTGFEPVLPP